MFDSLTIDNSKHKLQIPDFNPENITGYINEPVHYLNDPEPNMVASRFGNIMYRLGQLTKLSAHFRTPFDRSKAQELLSQIKDHRVRSDSHSHLYKELKERGKIAKKYLQQGSVCVYMGTLGIQKSPLVIIPPPRVDPRFSARPVVLIPGISNGLAGIETLIKEFAYQGRIVIALGQPESFMGSVTPSFAQAVEESSQLSPHIEFYKRAIALTLQERFGNKVKIDLVGHSTGCPMIAGLLADKHYQDICANVCLVSPAAVAEQSVLSFDLATIPEIYYLLVRHGALANFNRNDQPQEPVKARATQGVKRNIIHFLQGLYKNAHLSNHRRISVISCDDDHIVKSRQAQDALAKLNPDIDFIPLSRATHAEALINPQRVVTLIQSILK